MNKIQWRRSPNPFGTQWQIRTLHKLYIWKDNEMRKLTTKCSHHKIRAALPMLSMLAQQKKKNTLDDEKSKHIGLA
jgi:hypothetical protein